MKLDPGTRFALGIFAVALALLVVAAVVWHKPADPASDPLEPGAQAVVATENGAALKSERGGPLSDCLLSPGTVVRIGNDPGEGTGRDVKVTVESGPCKDRSGLVWRGNLRPVR